MPTVFSNKPCGGTVHVQTIKGLRKSSVFPVRHRVMKVSIHSVGLAGGTSLALQPTREHPLLLPCSLLFLGPRVYEGFDFTLSLAEENSHGICLAVGS